MNTLVCAACNDENTDWVKQIPGAFQENGWIRSVNNTTRPLGREAFVYLDYITGHYNEISPRDEVILCQGNPFNHCPTFIEDIKDPLCRYYGPIVECNKIGEPHCTFTPLHEWSDVLKLPLRENYKFVAGAQYRLYGYQIKTRKWDFYQAMLWLTMIPNNKAAWVYERLWAEIWNLTDLLPH